MTAENITLHLNSTKTTIEEALTALESMSAFTEYEAVAQRNFDAIDSAVSSVTDVVNPQ